MVCPTLALALGFDIMTFDVETAFLSGKDLQRELYVRAPRDGLPAVEGWPRIRPYKLLKLLKGAYGLTEAPRLWYLRAKEILERLGFEEIRCCRAVFVFMDKSKQRQEGHFDHIVAFLTLHMDDGMLFGNRKDKRFMKVLKALNENFSIKQWQYLEEGKELEYLVLQCACERDPQGDRVIYVHMDRYINNELKKIPVKRGDPDDRVLTDDELTAFRGAMQRARWPIAHVVPSSPTR